MPVIQTICPMGPLDVAVLCLCLIGAVALFLIWTVIEDGRKG